MRYVRRNVGSPVRVTGEPRRYTVDPVGVRADGASLLGEEVPSRHRYLVGAPACGRLPTLTDLRTCAVREDDHRAVSLAGPAGRSGPVAPRRSAGCRGTRSFLFEWTWSPSLSTGGGGRIHRYPENDGCQSRLEAIHPPPREINGDVESNHRPPSRGDRTRSRRNVVSTV